jgi:hypothetical protein
MWISHFVTALIATRRRFEITAQLISRTNHEFVNLKARSLRDGASRGPNILTAGILRMDDDALDPLDQFERAVSPFWIACSSW